MRAWTRLMRAHKALVPRIEGALRAAGLPPLAWYDVLLELDREAATGLRPYALEERLLLPQYGLSRLLARLEQAGLVTRAPSPEDGRGQIVRISAAGQALRRRMWPVYARALQDHVGAALEPGEAATLARLLERLIE